MAERPQTLLIDGYVYDIEQFAKRHPGGNVIRFYAGQVRGKKGRDIPLHGDVATGIDPVCPTDVCC